MAKTEHFAYGSILEALSSGLYPDKRFVVREFVQNAFDALNTWKKKSGEQSISPIEIKIQKPSIVIADRGLGMDESEAQKFRYLGYSAKDKRETVGFRGIGKDSGLAVAERIIVTTSRHGIPVRSTIIINAQDMLEESASNRNTPLEELLEKHSSVKTEGEDSELHYTFVELNSIRKDAEILFDTKALKEHLHRNCPIPFDPNFDYAGEILDRLRLNVPNFADVSILLDGEKLYKPFPANYSRPEYEFVFESDETGASVIAYCWYCGNTEKGQLADKDNSGLIYRIKDFAVGDRHLTRRTLWDTTPERAFYFFGEIHILDEAVIPSSDRTNLEDNAARVRLYDRCRRIAQILSQRAGTESAQRTFDNAILDAEDKLSLRKTQLDERDTAVQIQPEIEYEVRKVIEDLNKRMDRVVRKREPSIEDLQLVSRGGDIIEEAKTVLKRVQAKEGLVDIGEKLELNNQARQVYQIIIDCLKEEFSFDVKRLERIVDNINKALSNFFKG